LARNAQGQLAPVPGTGDSWADFLLGVPANGLMSGLGVVEYRGTRVSIFLQDTWRVTRELTINYGLSLFLSTVPDPRGQARETVHAFDLSTGLLKFASLGQTDPKVSRTDLNNWAPRLGLAWRPARLHDTVIRAGGGIYFSEVPWLATFPNLVGPPYAIAQTFVNSQTNPIPQFELGRNIFVPQPVVTPGPEYARNIPAGTATGGVSLDLPAPYVTQWNLSLQRAIGSKDLLELAYLGSSGHRQLNYVDMAQCRPVNGLLCDPSTKPWNARYGLVVWLDTSGNTSYNGMFARYEHRGGGGLSVRFEYALAKNLADTWQTSFGPLSQIASCRRCDRGPTSFDIRHRVSASAVWELPFGRGRRYGSGMPRAADLLAGGWSATAIVSAATGQPVYLTGPNRTGSPLILHLPDRVCDGRDARLSDNLRQNGFLWFDTSCFPVPQLGYFGNSGRTVIPGPGLSNSDIGIEKNVPLREALRIQFRAELFNAWNHTQFMPPNGDAGAGDLFGRISATRPPRLVQLGLKLLW